MVETRMEYHDNNVGGLPVMCQTYCLFMKCKEDSVLEPAYKNRRPRNPSSTKMVLTGSKDTIVSPGKGSVSS